MTIKQIEAHLKPWLASFQKIEEVYENLHKHLGVEVESSEVAAMYQAHEGYTNALAEILNCSADWTLSWFLNENGCGNGELEAKAASWKKQKPIRNIHDLAVLIYADYPKEK